LLALALVLSAGTAALILTRHRLLSGILAVGGGAALLAAESSVSDLPRSGRAFAGRMLDRLYEACILVPLAWVTRSGPDADTVLALVGLGASYLASYERAKGQALGYHGVERAQFQRTRYVILALALLTGWLFGWLLVFAILTVAAAGVQAWNVVRQDRAGPAAGETEPAADGAVR
jgi:hypothetical protein